MKASYKHQDSLETKSDSSGFAYQDIFADDSNFNSTKNSIQENDGSFDYNHAFPSEDDAFPRQKDNETDCVNPQHYGSFDYNHAFPPEDDAFPRQKDNETDCVNPQHYGSFDYNHAFPRGKDKETDYINPQHKNHDDPKPQDEINSMNPDIKKQPQNVRGKLQRIKAENSEKPENPEPKISRRT
jgi:hypothetical protein